MSDLQTSVDCRLVPRRCTHKAPIKPPEIPSTLARLTYKHVQEAERFYQDIVTCAQDPSIPKSRRCNSLCGRNGYDFAHYVKQAYERKRRQEASQPEVLEEDHLAGLRKTIAKLCQTMDRSANRGRYRPSDDSHELGTVMFNDGYEPYFTPHDLPPIYKKRTIWELDDRQLEAYERGYALIGKIMDTEGTILDPIEERRQRLYMSLSGHWI